MTRDGEKKPRTLDWGEYRAYINACPSGSLSAPILGLNEYETKDGAFGRHECRIVLGFLSGSESLLTATGTASALSLHIWRFPSRQWQQQPDAHTCESKLPALRHWLPAQCDRPFHQWENLCGCFRYSLILFPFSSSKNTWKSLFWRKRSWTLMVLSRKTLYQSQDDKSGKCV